MHRQRRSRTPGVGGSVSDPGAMRQLTPTSPIAFAPWTAWDQGCSTNYTSIGGTSLAEAIDKGVV